MAHEDFIRIGLLAAKEFNVLPDVSIEFVPICRQHILKREDKSKPLKYDRVYLVEDLIDIVSFGYQHEDGRKIFYHIGYSSLFNVLVISV